MTNKPEVYITKTLAAMVRGYPLHKIQALCEQQKSVSCSVLTRMFEEAQDINTDYALIIKYSHEASRAADKARISELEECMKYARTVMSVTIQSELISPVCHRSLTDEIARTDAALSQSKESIQ